MSLTKCIAEFVSTDAVACLLETHPNQAGDLQKIWHLHDWWDWAGKPERWKTLAEFHDQSLKSAPSPTSGEIMDIPSSLRNMIQTLSSLELDRKPSDLAVFGGHCKHLF